MAGKRPETEVRETLYKYQECFGHLVNLHEDYVKLIEDDAHFEEEAWLNECKETFMETEFNTKLYLEANFAKGKGADQDINTEQIIPGPSGASADSVDIVQTTHTPENNDSPDSDIIQTSSSTADNSKNDSLNSDIVQITDSGTQATHAAAIDIVQTTANPPVTNSITTCNFKIEKPKLPIFNGDVREYAIFRADFKHAVESHYSERDAITFLRTCLRDKPLQLIKGIGTDYRVAWDYLDAIYGDPRYVSDTIIQDISKFKALQQGEDGRFCDLVHLFNRSYNTLKEVGTQNDLNNSHMLAVIEKKMCAEEVKVWLREIERAGGVATLEGLLKWMSCEMKLRMRATAPLRSVTAQQRGGVYQLSVNGNEKIRHKCWLCKNSDHWPD